jgi:4-amino-4-deoxy-L-arabinose transferase-like glycosyltransferase
VAVHPDTAMRVRRARLHANVVSSPPALLFLLLLLGAVLRLWMLAHGVPAMDSDEAAFGLMALHIPRGDWSVFMWGQPYMGTFETFCIAPFLAIFGPSALSLRLGPLALGLIFIATTYLRASRIYSRRVGLYTAALLSVGSPFFVVLSVRAYGGYVETLLFGNLLLLLALAGKTSHGQSTWMAALTGLVSGLALWTDLLVVPYIAVASLVFWWQRRADVRGQAGLALFASLIVGAAPALFYNLTHGAPTLGSVLALTVAGTHGAHGAHAFSTILATLPSNLWLELTVSFPILVGAFLGGTQGAGLTTADYMRQAARQPATYAVALTVGLCAIALFCCAALRVARECRVRSLRVSRHGDCDATLVRRQGEAALILLALCYAGAFALSGQPDIFATPRYLLPLFAATPVVVAQGERAVSGLLRRILARGPAPASLWLSPLVVAMLCVWNLAGDVGLTPLQTAARDHGIWVAGDDANLLRTLSSDSVHTVISNDYWEGLRLTFESGETILSVMMTSPGHLGFNRYQPYVDEGLADPRPAYLELTGTPEASRDVALLREGRYPGYRLTQVGAYTVLLPPPWASVAFHGKTG